MNEARPWSGSDVETLRALWLEMDIDVIALRLGRSVDTVKWKARHLKLGSRRGISDRRKNPEDMRLRQLWGGKGTRQDIADTLGRSLSYVNVRAVELGLPPRRVYRQDTSLVAQVQDEDNNVAVQLRQLATAHFLIAFKRAGYTAEHYRRHCEMPAQVVAAEPCLRDNQQPRPRLADFRTFMGSQGAMCAELAP